MRSLVAPRSSRVLFAFALSAVFASGSLAAGSDGVWYPVPIPAAPDLGPAFAHTIVFDTLHQRFVAFGWFNSGETWTHAIDQPEAWSPLATAGTPPAPRLHHSAVYDPIAHRMLVFGGNTDGSLAIQNDLWQLDFTTTPATWSLIATTGAIPSPHQAHSAIFDAARNRMVVYGGWTGTAAMDEVWILDCSTMPPSWQLASIGGPTPAARAFHCGIFDTAQDRMVIFGGYGTPGSSGDLTDVWTLSMDPLAWTQVLGSSGPDVPFFAVAAYEPLGHRMLVTNGELWSLDLDQFTWTPWGSEPGTRYQAAFALDPSGQHGVLQGGEGPFESRPDTWLLRVESDPSWSPGGALANRTEAAAVYDPPRDRFLMLGGGFKGHPFGDILELQVGRDSSWVEAMPSAPFGPRRGLGAVYDPLRDRVIVIGGYNGTWLNDTWIVQLAPSLTVVPANVAGTPPPGRDFFSAIYDPLRDRVVLYGGNANGAFGDVWALNLSPAMSWEPITPVPGPAPVPRYWHDALYDSDGDRMLVFGGFAGGALADLWSLSLDGVPTWTQLNPTGAGPGPRAGHSFEFDPNRHRAILFGSTAGNDTWELKLGGQAPVWNLLSPGGTAPPRRAWHVGVYDPIHDCLLVSGGKDWDYDRDDVWRLQFANDVVATAMALLSSEARSDEVVLKWGLSGDPAPYAQLERREATTDWRAIASGPTSGSFVTFRDGDVVAGARYAYRLVAVGGAETTTSAEVWINVPSGPQFSLGGFLPNPADGSGLRVAFSLPDRSPATLEVVDLSGRRILRRHLDAPNPGAQTIALAPTGDLKPGLYFVKLTQGRRTLVARGTVVR